MYASRAAVSVSRLALNASARELISAPSLRMNWSNASRSSKSHSDASGGTAAIAAPNWSAPSRRAASSHFLMDSFTCWLSNDSR